MKGLPRMPGIIDRIYGQAKILLAKVTPDSKYLKYLAHLPEFDRWKKQHNEPYRFFEDRHALYDYINTEIVKNKPIDYVEFGVYKGSSIKYWSGINTDASSRFWGFDTFTGLPEAWEMFSGDVKAGVFDAKGELPDIPDRRVAFLKGLFQDTLPGFLKSNRLSPDMIVHMDADIYSSTLYVLTKLNDSLMPGTIIIFDEFNTIMGEFMALNNYCSAYLRQYEILGATRSKESHYLQVAIRMK